jgi:Asp-tRNA(Asn)/Glu-tRNA(Gln) amidotransferase A subunit family amidase
MARFPEYETFDAVGLAELVRRKELSAAEIAEAAIERIDRRDSSLNAVICRFYDDPRWRLPISPGDAPLAGVPYLFKDLGVHCAGFPTTSASRYLKGFIASRDSTLVERCRAAGMTILGKTNTCEFGLCAATEPVFTGTTFNPWSRERSAGGSSGGSAVAVAAGMVPAAAANDGGGSIRIPAANCGLFGLKPTRARTPVGPDIGEVWSGLTTYHAITRTVRDSAALLDATAGPAAGDPYWAPPPSRPFAAEVETDPGRLRIAITTRAPGGYPVHADCRGAVAIAARLCESLGHVVEEAAPDFDLAGLKAHFRTLWGVNLASNLEQYRRAGLPAPGPADLETITKLVAEEGRQKSGCDYLQAVRAFHRVGRDFAAFFQTYDVLITPTMTQPPWPLGTVDMMENDLDRFTEVLFSLQAFTPQFNVTGQPAASIPLHWNREGLPIGVQVATRFGDEATLLRLCGQLERAAPWIDRCLPTLD